MRTQGVDQVAQLRRREEVRGAAAQVQLDHFAIAVEQLGSQRDLAVQAHQVGFAAC